MMRPWGQPAYPLAGWQDQFLTGMRTGLRQGDPALAEIVELASEIVAVERQPGGALDPRVPTTFQVSDLKRPMWLYLFYRKHPVLTYSIPVGLLLLAFALGRASARSSPRGSQ
jgi:hypothetical protein